MIAALQTVEARIGEGVFGVLAAGQPPSIESMMTAIVRDIADNASPFLLVLDDYHLVQSSQADEALAFLLEHMPPRLHLIIATREEPKLPIARLRARDQVTELRIADLRFTRSEAEHFLNKAMGLSLSPADVALLADRTEGWIAGLQLAGLALRGHSDTEHVLRTFTGSHRFVLDYLVEDVLSKLSPSVQAFLLLTCILDRLSGPICDAVLGTAATPSQQMLHELERANLFLLPLDDERRWYRYHHLFGELLRQLLYQGHPHGVDPASIPELHKRASAWYEANGFEIDALQHAAAAQDVDLATRLIEGNGMPLHFRGGTGPVLQWLESQPADVLAGRPSLLVIHASAMLMVGRMNGVEPKLRAAEAALEGMPTDAANRRDLLGHIASIRATLAVSRHEADTIIDQSRLALELLHPNNLPVRTATTWTLGYAHHLKGDRAAAREAYGAAIAISEAIGHRIVLLMATIGLGNMQEADNQLDLATATYRRVLELAGDPPVPAACEAHHGLARISYERNDLAAALHHGELSLHLARQLENTDRFVASELFLARVKLALGDLAGASALIDGAELFVRRHGFSLLQPDIAAAQIQVLLRRGDLPAAAKLSVAYELPLSCAQVQLAQGEAGAAYETLEAWRRQAEASGWADERLRAMTLQALALSRLGEREQAEQQVAEALALAEPAGFIRLFLEEGKPMAQLLHDVTRRGTSSSASYANKLLSAWETDQLELHKHRHRQTNDSHLASGQLVLIELLSERELNVLRLIAEGLSNQAICERLYLALSTVKGYNQTIFAKLQVERRTEAVARARELGLLD